MSAIESKPSSSDTGSDLFPGFSQRRRRGVRVTTAAAIALGLSLTGGAVAGAASTPSTPSAPAGASQPSAHSGQAPPEGGPPAAVGTVASVGTGTFTLTTRNNTTVTVNVSGTTAYLARGVTSPTVANVTTGERVAVFGTESSGVVSATKVAIGVPADGRAPGGGPGGGPGRAPGGGPGAAGQSPPAAVGTVASVGTESFTVTTLDNTTVTVKVSGGTAYLDPGVTSPTLANVTTGTRVAVFGAESSGVVAATRVAIGVPGSGPAGPGGPGGPNDVQGAPPAGG